MIRQPEITPLYEQSSHLLDEVMRVTEKTAVHINGRTYRARLLNFNKRFSLRLRGALRVLTGRSVAVHFKTDER